MSRAERGSGDGGPPSHLLSRFQPTSWIGLKVAARGSTAKATVLSTASGWVTIRLLGVPVGASGDPITVRKRAYDLWVVGDVSSLPTRGPGGGERGDAPEGPSAAATEEEDDDEEEEEDEEEEDDEEDAAARGRLRSAAVDGASDADCAGAPRFISSKVQRTPQS